MQGLDPSTCSSLRIDRDAVMLGLDGVSGTKKRPLGPLAMILDISPVGGGVDVAEPSPWR
jgi:hypothetical protein